SSKGWRGWWRTLPCAPPWRGRHGCTPSAASTGSPWGRNSAGCWARSSAQVELLHLVAQGVAGDAQQARGLGLVAGGLLERAGQQHLLVLLEREALGRNVGHGGGAGELARFRPRDGHGQAGGSDVGAVFQNHGALDG